MRKILSLLALSAALPVLAQEAPAPKFAVVIPDYILGNSARGKKVTAEFVELRKSLDERMRAKSEELQKLAQQLKSPGLSDEGRAKVQRDLQDGEIALKRAEEDAQKEFNLGREKVSKTYQQEIRPIVEVLAKEWKLQVLFNYQEGLFQYADETWLTSFSNEIIKRYDAKFPAEGTAKAPVAPAPKPGKGVGKK
ncbi:OmpH family outer membrane protein [Holophaga foetida]|uniref:OmpH family outer membrane protein n=1 Tax=Holophaga foetida TaxID=35839 RepID=UPI00024753C0|nr:OmpH family outer membrane protein [Holophaga foetida]